MIVHDVSKLRHRYVTSGAFKLDVVSVLPTDLVFLVSYESYFVIARLNRVLRTIEFGSVVRRRRVGFSRVLRIRRLWELFDRTESSTSSPNSFRMAVLVFHLLTAIHWNACFYFQMSAYNGFGSDDWVYVDINETLYPRNATLLKMYSYRFVLIADYYGRLYANFWAIEGSKWFGGLAQLVTSLVTSTKLINAGPG